jgi:N-acetyl-anhydromuramyl-L-alanine amidase AmpD
MAEYATRTEEEPMRFDQAAHYTPVAKRTIDLLVIHTMESPEKPDTAEAVANWFAGSGAPEASAHYCIDNNTVVQCVRDHDVAWAAPGANHNGLHFEHAGRAAQSKKDWSDPYSTAMLLRSANLAAQKCKRYGIPVRRLTAAELKAGRRGLCGHIDVTRAFRKGTHTDPGVDFPWDRYLRYVRAFKAGRKPRP